MSLARGCVWAVLSALLLHAQSATAAPVGYNLVSGQLTAVTLDFDQTNRLAAPLSLDSGAVSVDFDALQLYILSVGAAGTGNVALGGINGWDNVSFSNASFASTQAAALGAPPPSNPGTYSYGVPVQVLADLVLDPSAPGAPNVPVNGFNATSNAGGTIIALNGNDTLRITINGVVLGELPDPVHQDAPKVLVKADFDFIAARADLPELPASILSLLGLAAALWRRRSA